MRKSLFIPLFITAAVALPVAPVLAHGSSSPLGDAWHSRSHSRPTPSGSATSSATSTASPRPQRTVLYVGQITAIDLTDFTLTVRVHGRARHAAPVVVPVPATAVIRRLGVTVPLATLAVGDKVVIRGTRIGTVLTVQRVTVIAAHKRWPRPHHTPTATPTPTATATAVPAM